MRVTIVVAAAFVLTAALPALAGDRDASSTGTPSSGAQPQETAAPQTAKPASPPATPAQPEPSSVVKTKTKSNQSND